MVRINTHSTIVVRCTSTVPVPGTINVDYWTATFRNSAVYTRMHPPRALEPILALMQP